MAHGYLRSAQLIGLLQVQPDLRRRPEITRQAERRVGGHAALPVQDRREEAARTHPDPEEQRQAQDRVTMAQFAKRQTLENIEGAGNMPFASLESVFRTVELQYRTAEDELTAAREQLAQAKTAAAR